MAVLQAGVPASPELLLIMLVAVVQVLPAVVVIGLIYRDANRRGSEHALAWAAGGFFGGPAVWILYYVVRDEVGPGGPAANV